MKTAHTVLYMKKHIQTYASYPAMDINQLYERGVDLEVEGVCYIEIHRGPAAYILGPPPSRGRDIELEDIIRTKFIPAICERSTPNDELRDLLALPCRLGGLGIPNPTCTASNEYSASKAITTPIARLILSHEGSYKYETHFDQLSAVALNRKTKRHRSSSHVNELQSSLPPELQKAMDLSQEKGASNWLTVLPVEEFGFFLHKGAFRDALALRYGWPLYNTPSTCSYGSHFTVEHALSCPKGGYPSIDITKSGTSLPTS